MVLTKLSSEGSWSNEKSTSVVGVISDFSRILDALACAYWIYGAVSPSKLRDFAKSKVIILSKSCLIIS